MAGGSKLGSIYVELSLDDKIYKQKLASMPADAQATTKGLETSWRSLGVKTNQYFDDSRKAADNAYRLIEKSGKYSADEILRAERAKNETITRLNEQQFGKTEGYLTKLKDNWVAAAAAITAAYMAAQKAWNIAEQAASYEQSAVAFHTMATSMGTDATTEFNKIKEASKGLIDDKSLTESINKAMSLGIPLESIAGLMEIAQAKSRDMGTTTQQAFSDISTGVGRASPLILDNLGLVMKVGTANEAMAASLGKTVDQLTDQEKKTAILNATLDAGKEAVARYNLEQLTTAERMQTLSATVTNIQLLIGQGLIRAFAGAQGAMQTLASGALVAVAGFYKLQQASLTVASWTSFGEAAKKYAAAAKEAGDNSAAAMGASEELAGKATASFAAMTASTKALSSATTTTATATKIHTEQAGQQSAALAKAGKASEEAAEKKKQAAEKEGAAIIKAYENEEKKATAYYENLDKERQANAVKAGNAAVEEYKRVEEAAAKETAARQAASDSYQKLIEKDATVGMSENEKAISKILEDQRGKVTELNKIQESGYLKYEDYQKAMVSFNKTSADKILNQERGSKTDLEKIYKSLKDTGIDYSDDLYKARVTDINNTISKMKTMNAPAAAVAQYAETAFTEADKEKKRVHNDWVDTAIDKMNGMKTPATNAATAAETAFKNMAKNAGEKWDEYYEAIEEGAGYIKSTVPANAGTAKTALENMAKDADKQWGYYYEAVEEGGGYIKKDIPAAAGLAKTGLENMSTDGKTAVEALIGKVNDTKEALKNEDKNKGVVGAAKAVKDAIDQMATDSGTAVGNFVKNSITGEGGINAAWKTFTEDMYDNMIDALGKMVTDAATKLIKMTFDAVWDAGASVVIGAIGKLVNYFWGNGWAYGGMIPGQAAFAGDSPANDRVPARLSPGEYVMPRSAVNAETLPQLEYMRQNKRARGYAYGGLVEQLPGLTQSMYGDMKWYDTDEWEGLEDAYKLMHDYFGLTWYNGQWGKLGMTWTDEGNIPTSFSPIGDAITHTGQLLNELMHYQLQDENDPPQGLDRDDYKYLLDWYGSSLGYGLNTGWGEGGEYSSFLDDHGLSPLTGLLDPNVVWTESEGDGYRFYYRDGTNRYVDPSESNWLKRWMPSIIKTISVIMATYMGNVVGAYIAAGGAIGVGGVTGGAGLSSGLAAGASSTGASLGAAFGAGTAGGLITYGETGSLTASIIAALIAGAAGYAGASGGLFDLGKGEIISRVLRFGAKTILKQLSGDLFSISKPNVTMSNAEDDGLLSSLMSKMEEIAPKKSSFEHYLASGLDYVPYDNFPARLHKGERVVPANENRSGGNVFHIYLDGEEIKGRMRIIADKVFVDRASSGIGSLQRVYA